MIVANAVEESAENKLNQMKSTCPNNELETSEVLRTVERFLIILRKQVLRFF